MRRAYGNAYRRARGGTCSESIVGRCDARTSAIATATHELRSMSFALGCAPLAPGSRTSTPNVWRMKLDTNPSSAPCILATPAVTAVRPKASMSPEIRPIGAVSASNEVGTSVPESADASASSVALTALMTVPVDEPLPASRDACAPAADMSVPRFASQ